MPTGEVGEIRIRGPNVTKGYWNRPKETAEAFVGDRFLTGDIGYVDADGYFYLVDRKKDMIISGGFNVYPQMIEQAIYTHPAVQEVIVIGIPDDYRGEAAKAFIKLRDDAKPFTAGGIAQLPHRQARQARTARGGRVRRRTAAHPGRQALAPRTAPADRAGAEAATSCGSGGRFVTTRVVPAKAGTHTPRASGLEDTMARRPCITHERRWLWVPAFAGTTER